MTTTTTDIISTSGLKIIAGADCYGTPTLVDAATGKTVRFQAARVEGRGWTVVKVTGSKRTGRTAVRADGFEGSDSYTMHQAVAAAAALKSDTMRAVADQA